MIKVIEIPIRHVGTKGVAFKLTLFDVSWEDIMSSGHFLVYSILDKRKLKDDYYWHIVEARDRTYSVDPPVIPRKKKPAYSVNDESRFETGELRPTARPRSFIQ